MLWYLLQLLWFLLQGLNLHKLRFFSITQLLLVMVSIGVVVIFVARFKFSQLEIFLHYSTPTQAHMEELKKQRDIWKPYKHNNVLARIGQKIHILVA